MILSSELLSDGTLHQPRERGKHVDWRVDLPVVQLSVDEDLAFRDITCQI